MTVRFKEQGDWFGVAPLKFLNGKHTLKERTVTLERDPQVFGRYIVALIPLLLQLGSLICEPLGQPIGRSRADAGRAIVT